MFLETVVVAGLNCEHCVRSLTEEIAAIGEVGVVEADPASGLVTLISVEPVDRAELREAIELAGYRLQVPALS